MWNSSSGESFNAREILFLVSYDFGARIAPISSTSCRWCAKRRDKEKRNSFFFQRTSSERSSRWARETRITLTAALRDCVSVEMFNDCLVSSIPSHSRRFFHGTLSAKAPSAIRRKSEEEKKTVSSDLPVIQSVWNVPSNDEDIPSVGSCRIILSLLLWFFYFY